MHLFVVSNLLSEGTTDILRLLEDSFAKFMLSLKQLKIQPLIRAAAAYISQKLTEIISNQSSKSSYIYASAFYKSQLFKCNIVGW